jgi:hypothetical protein
MPYQVYVLEIASSARHPGLKSKLPKRSSAPGSTWFYVGITSNLERRIGQHTQGEKSLHRKRAQLELQGKKPRVRLVQPLKAISQLRDGAPLVLGEDVYLRPDLVPGGNRFETKERAEKMEARVSRRLRAKGHEVFSDQ